MNIEDYNYFLPRELIAQRPSVTRDSARLLILHRNSGKIEHKKFYQIDEYLRKGDVLVLNNTRVIPARLKGRKKDTGGRVEIFLLRKRGKNLWECLLKPAGRVREDSQISFPEIEVYAKVLKKIEGAKALVKFSDEEDIEERINRIGEVPLPPYIKREKGPSLEDKERYQTLYAKENGAVAAPTAGLHFTLPLLGKIRKKGVKIVEITLHTGWASFKPLREKRVEDNKLPSEYFKITRESAFIINKAKREGSRVIAVGTTTTRALETSAGNSGIIKEKEDFTDLFIYPGYKFKIIDALITNFHMPASSLLLLVCAFAEKEKVLFAYKEAIKKKYRFLSFGDAMLIV
ncbi:tRNA preQ1(34) S-adenosylmethionine ribosyltransferase-isomerase QueA [Candidatus Aerophobetes bacterium]|nr:tRNA preQ1(34) S-adenosylmethionine ribosyltransferase-isomerase QueA [Candidatus Aerophobetes bacterium]